MYCTSKFCNISNNSPFKAGWDYILSKYLLNLTPYYSVSAKIVCTACCRTLKSNGCSYIASSSTNTALPFWYIKDAAESRDMVSLLDRKKLKTSSSALSAISFYGPIFISCSGSVKMALRVMPFSVKSDIWCILSILGCWNRKGCLLAVCGNNNT